MLKMKRLPRIGLVALLLAAILLVSYVSGSTVADGQGTGPAAAVTQSLAPVQVDSLSEEAEKAVQDAASFDRAHLMPGYGAQSPR